MNITDPFADWPELPEGATNETLRALQGEPPPEDTNDLRAHARSIEHELADERRRVEAETVARLRYESDVRTGRILDI